MTAKTGITRTFTGRVISNRMNRTATVVLERMEPHPLYGKYVRRSTKVHAHDQDNSCNEGDWVVIESCRPLSKTKAWRVVKVLDKKQ